MENSNYGVSKQIEKAKARLDELYRIHMFRMWTDNEWKEYNDCYEIVNKEQKEMADYIDREELIKAITNDEDLLSTYGTADRLEETIAKINSMHSVDAVEVVRCKDCKYNEKNMCRKFKTEHIGYGMGTHYVEDDDFCHWGGEKE